MQSVSEFLPVAQRQEVIEIFFSEVGFGCSVSRGGELFNNDNRFFEIFKQFVSVISFLSKFKFFLVQIDEFLRLITSFSFNI
jgi:hypothetical protein